MQVGDAVLALEDPGALELSVLGRGVFEQTAACAEEHRNDMKLELVEDPGGEQRDERIPDANLECVGADALVPVYLLGIGDNPLRARLPEVLVAVGKASWRPGGPRRRFASALASTSASDAPCRHSARCRVLRQRAAR